MSALFLLWRCLNVFKMDVCGAQRAEWVVLTAAAFFFGSVIWNSVTNEPQRGVLWSLVVQE